MTQIDDEKKIRLEMAKSIFEEVLDADLHQGEKAARLLVPVTFLTGATMFLFNFFLEREVSVVWRSIEFVPVLFLLYIFFTLCGILTFFEVIGPSFYVKEWPPPKKGPKGPKSTLFFKLISEIDNINEWVTYFSKKGDENPENYLKTDELLEKLIYDYAVESYQLAKKTHEKVKKNLIAHLFFYLSFYSLFLMVYLGIISYFNTWNWFTKLLVIIILAIFGCVEFKVAKKCIEE